MPFGPPFVKGSVGQSNFLSWRLRGWIWTILASAIVGGGWTSVMPRLSYCGYAHESLLERLGRPATSYE